MEKRGDINPEYTPEAPPACGGGRLGDRSARDEATAVPPADPAREKAKLADNLPPRIRRAWTPRRP